MARLFIYIFFFRQLKKKEEEEKQQNERGRSVSARGSWLMSANSPANASRHDARARRRRSCKIMEIFFGKLFPLWRRPIQMWIEVSMNGKEGIIKISYLVREFSFSQTQRERRETRFLCWLAPYPPKEMPGVAGDWNTSHSLAVLFYHLFSLPVWMFWGMLSFPTRRALLFCVDLFDFFSFQPPPTDCWWLSWASLGFPRAYNTHCRWDFKGSMSASIASDWEWSIPFCYSSDVTCLA